jgi:hypothetical protein
LRAARHIRILAVFMVFTVFSVFTVFIVPRALGAAGCFTVSRAATNRLEAASGKPAFAVKQVTASPA